MNNLKTFESFSSDIFGLPIFQGVTDEEDEKISSALHESLGEFQNAYFNLDEPSLGLKDAQEEMDGDIRSDYWLANPTVEYLRIVNPIEMNDLKKSHPDKEHQSAGSKRTWKWPVIYGTFIWYSIKPPKRQPGMTSSPTREHRIWMIAKDTDYSFRAIDTKYVTAGNPNPELRSAWDSAKPWEDLDTLLASQIPHLKSIGKYVQEHCENEYTEREEAKSDYDYDDDPNAGLEPWR